MMDAAQGQATAEKVPEKIDDVDRMKSAMKKLRDLMGLMDEGLAERVEYAIDEASEALESLDVDLENAINERDEAVDELVDLRDRVEDLDRNVTRLAGVYRDIQSGRTSEALHALDDVLCQCDSAWRTRA